LAIVFLLPEKAKLWAIVFRKISEAKPARFSKPGRFKQENLFLKNYRNLLVQEGENFRITAMS
jgi:hypothetical protein